MRDEARIDLETQLEEARAAWEQAEQSGAELAQHALQSDEELKSLRHHLAQLQANMTADSTQVPELERLIAVLAGALIYLLTCCADGDGLFLRFPDIKLPGYLMCGSPSLYLYLRNRWRKFRVKHDWVSWRQNAFANDLRQIWSKKKFPSR